MTQHLANGERTAKLRQKPPFLSEQSRGAPNGRVIFIGAGTRSRKIGQGSSQRSGHILPIQFTKSYCAPPMKLLERWVLSVFFWQTSLFQDPYHSVRRFDRSWNFGGMVFLRVGGHVVGGSHIDVSRILLARLFVSTRPQVVSITHRTGHQETSTSSRVYVPVLCDLVQFLYERSGVQHLLSCLPVVLLLLQHRPLPENTPETWPIRWAFLGDGAWLVETTWGDRPSSHVAQV